MLTVFSVSLSVACDSDVDVFFVCDRNSTTCADTVIGRSISALSDVVSMSFVSSVTAFGETIHNELVSMGNSNELSPYKSGVRIPASLGSNS